MNIFLTGGTGFLGGHFIEQALEAGHQVTALRRHASKSRRMLNQEPRWVNGDMSQDFQDILQGMDVLVHLAAHSTNPPYDSLDACIHFNVVLPLRMADQARLAGVQRFIVTGSCFEYGSSVPYPILPDSPLRPTNAYATSKAAAAVAFLGWAKMHGLMLQLLRVFHVYGPGELETRLWPALRRAALAGQDFPMSSGEQIRDFVPVEEAARQLVEALHFERVRPGLPVQAHVASGRCQSVLEFARHWWDAWGAQGRLLPGIVPHREDEVMPIVPDSCKRSVPKN